MPFTEGLAGDSGSGASGPDGGGGGADPNDSDPVFSSPSDPGPQPAPQPTKSEKFPGDERGDGGVAVVVVAPAAPVVVLSAVPTLNIPDQTVNEDAGFVNNLVDLFSNAADDVTAVASLIFSFVSQTAPSIISCTLDSGRFIDCTTQSDQNGFSDVTVSVTDGDGQTAFDTFRINVLPVDESAASVSAAADLETKEHVYIGSIAFDSEFVRPGDELLVYVNFENKGTEDLKDVRLTAIIQALGIRSPAVKVSEIDDGDKESEVLILEIPENAKPGRYDVEIVIDTDGKRRIKFRPIDVI